MKTVKSYLPAAAFETEKTFKLFSIEAQVVENLKMECPHGEVSFVLNECQCGFLSIAREEVCKRTVGYPFVVVFESPRDKVWTDGRNVASLEQKVSSVKANPECFLCRTRTQRLVKRSNGSRARETWVQVACEACVPNGEVTLEEFQSGLGVEVKFDDHGWIGAMEVEEKLFELDMEIQSAKAQEAFTQVLENDQLREQIKGQLSNPTVAIAVLMSLSILPIDQLRTNAAGIIDLFSEVDPFLLDTVQDLRDQSPQLAFIFHILL